MTQSMFLASAPSYVPIFCVYYLQRNNQKQERYPESVCVYIYISHIHICVCVLHILIQPFSCNCHLHKIPLCMCTSFSLSISRYYEWYNNKHRCLRVSLLCGLRLFRCIPRSAVVGSHSNSSFLLSFLRRLHAYSHSGCTRLFSHWKFIVVALSPQSHEHLLAYVPSVACCCDDKPF